MTAAPSASPSAGTSDELPLAARAPGHAGLLPFVVGAALVWLVHEDAHPYATLAMSAYAAVIVSFLGGIHWGLAFRHAEPPLADATRGFQPDFWPVLSKASLSCPTRWVNSAWLHRAMISPWSMMPTRLLNSSASSMRWVV